MSAPSPNVISLSEARALREKKRDAENRLLEAQLLKDIADVKTALVEARMTCLGSERAHVEKMLEYALELYSQGLARLRRL